MYRTDTQMYLIWNFLVGNSESTTVTNFTTSDIFDLLMFFPTCDTSSSRRARFSEQQTRSVVCVCVCAVSIASFRSLLGNNKPLDVMCVCVCVFVRLCSQYCFVALAPQNCAYGLSSFSADGTSLHIGTMVDVCLTLHGVFKFCLTLGSQNSAQALKKQT